MWASLGGVGFAAGVLIGGILTAGPAGAGSSSSTSRSASSCWPPSGPWCPAPPGPRRPAIDVLGAVTVTAATGSFIYGMINAGDEGWADPGTLLPIAAAIVLYAVFVVVERTVPTP